MEREREREREREGGGREREERGKWIYNRMLREKRQTHTRMCAILPYSLKFRPFWAKGNAIYSQYIRKNKILALTPFLYFILQNFLEADSVRLHMILL